MSTHLDQILAATRKRVAACKELTPQGTLEAAAARHTPRGFAAALRAASQHGPAVIAELKKASPSRGLIRADFDARALAPAMQAGGAAALSVLTDEPFFQGSLRNLEVASATTTLPCLRKDFIVDEYQIVEARAHSADAILLIAAALTDAELRSFTHAAQALGLNVLCEVHTREEAERVADLGCDAYGVNNRDLRTFVVRIEKSIELAHYLPTTAVLVAESGIRTAEDFLQLHSAGFEAFLIGETFMRDPDPGTALHHWIAEASALAMQSKCAPQNR